MAPAEWPMEIYSMGVADARSLRPPPPYPLPNPREGILTNVLCILAIAPSTGHPTPHTFKTSASPQRTSLSSLTGAFRLVAREFDGLGRGEWPHFQTGVDLLASLLAAAVEYATGGWLPAQEGQPFGGGRALDVVLAELVSAGMATVSPSFLHYILGTSCHFLLEW